MHGIVGFCPQTNCIDSMVSVRITLIYFARLVGISDGQIDIAVTLIIKKVGLAEFENTAAG